MDDEAQGIARYRARQEAKRPLAREWAARAGIGPGSRLADIGCGPGLLARAYAAIVGESGHVLAVEWNAAAAGELRAAPPANLTLREQDAAAGLGGFAAEAILLTDTLHHARDPAALLGGLRAACLPETRLLLAEYDPAAPGLLGARLARRMAPAEALRLLRAAGFAPGPALPAPDEHYTILARPA